MKSCFGYVRVSTAKQGEGVSLEAQRDAITTYAERNGITITRWFEEKETAAKSGRPIFNNMVKALKRRDADGLVIHKIDRSARNFADWAKIGELADSGVDVHFATETLDFRSRGGRLSADIQAVIAADYIRNLRDETIKGIEGRLKQGLYPFKAPIGYLDNGGGKPKTPDPVRAPLVELAFKLYAGGQYSLRSLCKAMDSRGLHNDRGKPLSKHGLEAVLGNPFYCGLVKIKRTGAVYQGVHKSIVSVSLYDAVQDVRSGRSGKKVTKHNHLFRGLFRCQHCNFTLSPELQKGHIYYRCHTPGCATKTLREDAIEQSIVTTLNDTHLSTEDIQELTQKIGVWCMSRTTDDKIRVFNLKLAQVEDKLERLTDALVDRLIEKDTFAQRKEKLFLERVRLKEELERAQKRPDQEHVKNFLELIKDLAALYVSAIPQEKRAIVQLATSNRTVFGRYVLIEPANWLVETKIALAGLIGDPSRPTSRSSPELRNRDVEALCSQVQSSEYAKLQSVANQSLQNASVEL